MTTSDPNLARGFRFEVPDVLVGWGSSVTDVLDIFAAKGLSEPRQVTPLYYTANCQVLGGVQCQVGFYFEMKHNSPSLNQIELFNFINEESHVEASYRVFQERLLQHFGPPTKQQPGGLGVSMPYSEWRVGSVRILHYVIDRFGLEERLSIQKR